MRPEQKLLTAEPAWQAMVRDQQIEAFAAWHGHWPSSNQLTDRGRGRQPLSPTSC
jgi:hypothetical protein